MDSHSEEVKRECECGRIGWQKVIVIPTHQDEPPVRLPQMWSCERGHEHRANV